MVGGLLLAWVRTKQQSQQDKSTDQTASRTEVRDNYNASLNMMKDQLTELRTELVASRQDTLAARGNEANQRTLFRAVMEKVLSRHPDDPWDMGDVEVIRSLGLEIRAANAANASALQHLTKAQTKAAHMQKTLDDAGKGLDAANDANNTAQQP